MVDRRISGDPRWSNEGSSSAVRVVMRASGGEASENVLKPDIVEWESSEI